jgi:hypothetical protein
MARSEGKAWLSSHVLSQLMQARVPGSSGFGKLVVSAFPARLPNRGGGRISKIGDAAAVSIPETPPSLGANGPCLAEEKSARYH